MEYDSSNQVTLLEMVRALSAGEEDVMPTYSGYVQYLRVVGAGYAFVSIGSTADDADLLVVTLDSTDTTAEHCLKRILIKVLSKACACGFAVETYTPTGSSEITSVQAGPFEIAPNDQPVHEDFLRCNR